MALHFTAKPKPNADKGLRLAKIESQREIDKLGLVRCCTLSALLHAGRVATKPMHLRRWSGPPGPGTNHSDVWRHREDLQPCHGRKDTVLCGVWHATTQHQAVGRWLGPAACDRHPATTDPSSAPATRGGESSAVRPGAGGLARTSIGCCTAAQWPRRPAARLAGHAPPPPNRRAEAPVAAPGQTAARVAWVRPWP